jgi:FkbM family methyltransferase
MNYAYAFDHIPIEDVKLIFELGARDCEDSVALQKRYGCPVYAFECNPAGLTICDRTLEREPGLPITLTRKAVNSYDGETAFFPFNAENIGASSLFIHEAENVQTEIVVPCCRLDTFIQENALRAPDLLCMDIQSAEMIALQSLGSYLDDVKYVATECSIEGFYKGSYSFREIYEFMHERGYEIVQSEYTQKQLLEFAKGNTYGQKEMDVLWVKA